MELRMKYLLIFSFLLASVSLQAQEVEVVKFEGFEKILKEKRSKVTVINFWATWCGPCIKEMPHFEALSKDYQKEVDVIFVSLDFIEKLDKVEAFIDKRNINSRVLLLNDIDYNSWIDKVEPKWSGAIPATLILTPEGDRTFIGQEVSKDELYTSVKSILDQ